MGMMAEIRGERSGGMVNLMKRPSLGAHRNKPRHRLAMALLKVSNASGICIALCRLMGVLGRHCGLDPDYTFQDAGSRLQTPAFFSRIYCEPTSEPTTAHQLETPVRLLKGGF